MLCVGRLRTLNTAPDAFGEAGHVSVADGRHRNRLEVRLESHGFEGRVFLKDFGYRAGDAERCVSIGDWFGFGRSAHEQVSNLKITLRGAIRDRKCASFVRTDAPHPAVS